MRVNKLYNKAAYQSLLNIIREGLVILAINI